VRALDLGVDALATYRLARLLTEDELLEPVREWVWKNHAPDETKIGYFVTCPWCVSIWAGGLVAVARELAPGPWGVAARALAFSAVTGIVAQHT
jgi:hypothetical protein